MDRGAWWATVHGLTKSQTRLKQLSMLGSVFCFVNEMILGPRIGCQGN